MSDKGLQSFAGEVLEKKSRRYSAMEELLTVLEAPNMKNMNMRIQELAYALRLRAFLTAYHSYISD